MTLGNVERAVAPKQIAPERRQVKTMARLPTAVAMAMVVAVAACTSAPTVAPTAAPVAIATPTVAPTDALPVCDPPPAVPGPRLGCAEAISAARKLLPPVHAPITSQTFRYSCPGTGVGVPDCAVQMFGIVDITFLNSSHVIPQPTLRVRVSRGDEGIVLATIVPTAEG